MASLKSALAREALARSSKGSRDISARKERPIPGTLISPHAQLTSARLNTVSSSRRSGASGRATRCFSGVENRAVDRLLRETTWSATEDQANLEADADGADVGRSASTSPKRLLRSSFMPGVEGAIHRSTSAKFAASLRESSPTTRHPDSNEEDLRPEWRVDSPASRARSRSSHMGSDFGEYFPSPQSRSPSRRQSRQSPPPKKVRPRQGSGASSSVASTPCNERELEPGTSGGVPVALSSGSSSTGHASRIALSAGSATSSQAWSSQPEVRLRLGQRGSTAVTPPAYRFTPWRAGGGSSRDFGFPTVSQPDSLKYQSRMRSSQQNHEEKAPKAVGNGMHLANQDVHARAEPDKNESEIEDLIAIASTDVWADGSSTEGSSSSRSPSLICDFECGAADAASLLAGRQNSRQAEQRAQLAEAISEIENSGTEDVGPIAEDLLASEHLLEETRRRFHARHPSRRAAAAANSGSNAGVRAGAPRSSPGSATRGGSREAERFGVQAVPSAGRLSQAQIEELQETQRSLNEENMHLRRDSAALRARLLSWRRLQRRFENHHPENTSPLPSRLLQTSASTPQSRMRAAASTGSPAAASTSSPSTRGVRNAATPPTRQPASSASSPVCGGGGSSVSPAKQAVAAPTVKDVEPAGVVESQVCNGQGKPETELDVWSCFGRNKAVLEAQAELKTEVKRDAASSSAPPASAADCDGNSANGNSVSLGDGESVDLGTANGQLLSIQASLPSDACP